MYKPTEYEIREFLEMAKKINPNKVKGLVKQNTTKSNSNKKDNKKK